MFTPVDFRLANKAGISIMENTRTSIMENARTSIIENTGISIIEKTRIINNGKYELKMKDVLFWCESCMLCDMSIIYVRSLPHLRSSVR